MGCQHGQGYLLAKPMPASQAGEVVHHGLPVSPAVSAQGSGPLGGEPLVPPRSPTGVARFRQAPGGRR
jgi:hypothetical protein